LRNPLVSQAVNKESICSFTAFNVFIQTKENRRHLFRMY